MQVIKDALKELEIYCTKLNIDDSHGVQHIIRLLSMLKSVYGSHVRTTGYTLSERICLNIMLAIILHDVDDKKFVQSVDYANARAILKTINWNVEDDVKMIISMISKVGMSENGCSVDDNVEDWMYWPRHLDRIDALGYIGIRRIFDLTQNYLHTPMVIDGFTPILLTSEEVMDAARKSSYVALCQESVKNGGKKHLSVSGVDHMIEGIIPRTFVVKHTNDYIKRMYESEVEVIVKFIIAVSYYRKNTGSSEITLEHIKQFEELGYIH